MVIEITCYQRGFEFLETKRKNKNKEKVDHQRFKIGPKI